MKKLPATGFLVAAVFIGGLFLGMMLPDAAPPPFSRADIAAAERLLGLQFTDSEHDTMIASLDEHLKNYEKLRAVPLGNSVPPAIQFQPLPRGFTLPEGESYLRPAPVTALSVPENLEELAFCSVGELADLLARRKVTSVQLTSMYLRRLKTYGPQLACVITLTEELAMVQARQADQEIAAGNYRGPLHGIPCGIKDLLATRGYKTTWGAMPYKDQVIEGDATVVRKLEAAGAVLVAKLTMGALAWGDVWYGGKTRNPWNLEQGSSGSSAGSASATAAGLVAFAIGTETWGSIVSPSTRCAVSGLRPTYGRVSRNGAMALSWTMDKIGPICRTAEDCALVFAAICGPDGIDQTLYEVPFTYDHQIDLKGLRIGYLPLDSGDYPGKERDEAAYQQLRNMGVDLVEIALPDIPVFDLSFVLSAEAAAAFDELTRSNRDDLMVRQIRNAWPNVFRAARFIPAVEYINANRVRYQLIQEMAVLMESLDLYVGPSFGKNLLLTNLTGHPCVVVPNGVNSEGNQASFTFSGRLFDEGRLLAVARAWQEAGDHHRQHPPLVAP